MKSGSATERYTGILLQVPEQTDDSDGGEGGTSGAVDDQQTAVEYHGDQGPLLVHRVHLFLVDRPQVEVLRTEGACYV